MSNLNRENLVTGLRKLADIFEGSELPLPYGLSVNIFTERSPETAKSQIRTFLSAVGKAYKKDHKDFIVLVADGLPEGISLDLFIDKQSFGCQRVKVERLVVEEKWECGPVLDEIPDETV